MLLSSLHHAWGDHRPRCPGGSLIQCACDGPRSPSATLPCSSDAKPMALQRLLPPPRGGGAGGQPDPGDREQSLAKTARNNAEPRRCASRSRPKSRRDQTEMTQITENKARSLNVSAEMQSVTTRYQKEIGVPEYLESPPCRQNKHSLFPGQKVY